MNEPKAAKGFPGYYEIPSFSKYAINTNGILIHKSSGRVYLGNQRSEGYVQFSMFDDCGKQMTVGRHRALGLLKTTLSNRLKSDGKRIYDGYRFCFYSNAI